LKSGINKNERRTSNFVVSNKGALSRSDLILFVLVLVLVLVLGVRILSRTRDEDDDENDWSPFDFAT
jgi:preprotein translocase subunit SecG